MEEFKQLGAKESMDLLKVMENDDFAGFNSVIQKYSIPFNSRILINLPNVNKYLSDGPTLIAVAAFFQGVTTFNFLLKQGVSLNSPVGVKPLLHYAITGLHNGIIETLLTQPGIDTYNLFLPALRNGYHQLVDYIIQTLKEADPDQSNINLLHKLIEKNPLKAAIRSGDVNTVNYVLNLMEQDYADDDNEKWKSITSIEYGNKHSTALHAATLKMRESSGYETIIPLLVDKYPMQLETQDQEGRTPLLKSLIGWVKTQYNPASCIIINQIKIKYGDPNTQCEIISKADNNKMTPLHYAAKYGNYPVFYELMQIYKEYPKYINFQDNEKRTAIYHGVLNSNINILKIFINEAPTTPEASEAPKSLSIPDSRGLLPIHLAAKADWLEGFQILYKSNPSSIIQYDCSGMSPIMWAAVNGSQKIIQFLIDDPNTRVLLKEDRVQVTNRSVLHWLCLEGHYDIIKMLIEKHIFDDLNILSGDPNVTPLFFAAKKGYFEICELLIENGANPICDHQTKLPKDVARTGMIKDLLINAEKHYKDGKR